MKKTILITGSTDGIGLETARMVDAEGHHVLLHGRSRDRLDAAKAVLAGDPGSYVADLSRPAEVDALAEAVASDHGTLDVLINNAGVFKTPRTITEDGLDMRFMVNTIAPYLLTRKLLPVIPRSGRIVNLSSAAQSPVTLDALAGRITLTDMDAYAQSKLAITMWSRELAAELDQGPSVVAVNPGSLLATKMVREGFGTAGSDVRIGADILVRAAFADDFASASGQYYDNDAGGFASPHPDALDRSTAQAVVRVIEEVLARLGG